MDNAWVGARITTSMVPLILRFGCDSLLREPNATEQKPPNTHGTDANTPNGDKTGMPDPEMNGTIGYRPLKQQLVLHMNDPACLYFCTN